MLAMAARRERALETQVSQELRVHGTESVLHKTGKGAGFRPGNYDHFHAQVFGETHPVVTRGSRVSALLSRGPSNPFSPTAARSSSLNALSPRKALYESLTPSPRRAGGPALGRSPAARRALAGQSPRPGVS